MSDETPEREPQAGSRGPNYDWRHEAEHYRLECEKLRDLLGKVEASGDRYKWELDQLRAAKEDGGAQRVGFAASDFEICQSPEECADLANDRLNKLEPAVAKMKATFAKRIAELEQKLREWKMGAAAEAHQGDADRKDASKRIKELERENAELKAKFESADQRCKELACDTFDDGKKIMELQDKLDFLQPVFKERDELRAELELQESSNRVMSKLLNQAHSEILGQSKEQPATDFPEADFHKWFEEYCEHGGTPPRDVCAKWGWRRARE